MKNNLIFLSALLLGLDAIAQKPAIIHEQWTEKPALHPINDPLKKESAVILLDNRRVEFIDEGADKVGEYRSFHRIVHLNDDQGIESFNKVYLGYTDSTDIIDMRARAVLPNGVIMEVRKENMKDYQDEDGSKYKIFALEGLEKGAEVEYFYTIRRKPDYFGRETIQGKFPILDARLQILCPSRLIFQLKGYNSDIRIDTDTSHAGTTAYNIRLKDIPGAEEEKYAAYDANLKRIEYRLSYNKANSNGSARINTWNLLAQRIHSNYEVFTEKDLNRIGDLIEANGWQKLPDARQKIIAVENYLKKQFTSRNDIDMQNASNIEWMIKNKIASTYGIVRLYAGIFQKLGVGNQIVLTCNRNELVIDRSFENWNNTSDILFYFPGTGKYLAPTLPTFRYPWINPYWGAEDAFYCQTTTIGNYTTAIAAIRNVPLEDVTKSYHRTDVSLQLDPASDTVIAKVRETLAGYLSIGYRAAYTLSNPDDRRTMLKEMARSTTNSERIITSNVENADFESYTDDKPFVMEATIHSEGLLENAGRNLLLKIGGVIGKQEEMYQEKPRQFPLQVAFPHTLERFVDFIIPAGYKVKNPDDLVESHEYPAGGNPVLGFVSEYKIEGDTLRVHILETYKQTAYPLADYDNFKKVINAAADFTKVVLVLEKK
ncbi:DUF3857 domain-containing protein [Puia sp.]|jgi:hypothetical protein|uniref:DUF3857 domain-containing protein n=1 Tax=Puia sp. TaxID=2045100 RepID=UPI002F401F3F